ncbi:hypothetical protein F5Y13DRAFT_193691 [Hypoxylon sp. FL1857]|nr:hypothetical protein F5Y13DRAFT_193691 [Hypoxylon sp. FL1857]
MKNEIGVDETIDIPMGWRYHMGRFITPYGRPHNTSLRLSSATMRSCHHEESRGAPERRAFEYRKYFSLGEADKPQAPTSLASRNFCDVQSGSIPEAQVLDDLTMMQQGHPVRSSWPELREVPSLHIAEVPSPGRTACPSCRLLGTAGPIDPALDSFHGDGGGHEMRLVAAGRERGSFEDPKEGTTGTSLCAVPIAAGSDDEFNDDAEVVAFVPRPGSRSGACPKS